MRKDLNSVTYKHYHGLKDASRTLSMEEDEIQDTYSKVKPTVQ